MKCPVCKDQQLGEISLLEGLPANRCPSCSGVWMEANPYMAWKRAQNGDKPNITNPKAVDIKWDIQQLKLCPHSGHIMIRYKVVPQAEFYVDRCRHCNGVWFDANEWDFLVKNNLYDNVNEFFTQPWQDALRNTESKTTFEQLYLEKFGADDYQKAKDIRAWLTDHPKRNMLLAFLQSDDPYKP